MSKSRIAASIAGVFVAAQAFAAVPSTLRLPHVHSATATALHKAHLQMALKDILAAEAAGKSGQIALAEKAAAAAMKQIHAAVAHHKHNSQLHKHHHPHLTAALADLAKAEHQFKTGSVGTAEKDLAKAAAQVQQSLAHHHHTHSTAAKQSTLR